MSVGFHVPRHMSGRAVTLLGFGLIWLVIGIDIVRDPDDNPDLIYTGLPLWFRFLVWGAPGILAMIACASRRLQPAAFGMLTVAPVERLIGFAWAVFGQGNSDRISGTLIYLIVAVMTLILGKATIEKPPDIVVLPEGVAFLRELHPEWVVEARPASEEK